MVRICESNIILSMRPSSISLSRYLLLNHWAEFNQTCYITSPHGKGVREQHNFFLRPSVRPSASCYFFQTTGRKSTKFATSLPRMVRMCMRNSILSIRASVHLSVTLSTPKSLGGIQLNWLHDPQMVGGARAT